MNFNLFILLLPNSYPPKIIFDLIFSAASIANFISNPGIKGRKSLGKNFKRLATNNHEENLNMNPIERKLSSNFINF